MAEEVSHRAGLRDGAPKLVILVRGDDVAALVNVLRHVPVVVVGGEVEVVIARDGEQPSNATGSLERLRQVAAPEVLNFRGVGRRAADHCDSLVYQVPAVVNECAAFGCLPLVVHVAFDSLARPPVAVVVSIDDTYRAISQRSGRDGRKAVLGIVRIGEYAVVNKISIDVVRNRKWRVESVE